MAVTAITETDQLSIPRGSTLILSDGDAVNGFTYQLRIRGGTLTINNGGHNIVRAMDEDGDFVGPARKGAQAGPSTMAFSIKVFRTGGDATTLAAIDWLVQNSGSTPFGNLTTTEASGGDFTAMDATFALADVGTQKGASYLLQDCIPQPGISVTNAEDGIEISGTIESPDARVTITQNP